MLRYMPITILSLTLLSALMACAPKTVGPTAPAGYVFSLQAFPRDILRSTSSIAYSNSFSAGSDKVSDLIVRVQNRQGAAVDGVPVVFEIEPAWTRDAVVTPARVLTRKGKAEAHFRAYSLGVIRISARVENTSQEITIAVSAPGRNPVVGGGDGP